MFQSIGEIAALQPPGGRRTHQPIRRHSRPAGSCEGVFWRRIDRQERTKLMAAARRYELVTRHERRDEQPNTQNGALGLMALEVLEYLLNLMDRRTGRLEPSIDYLAAKLRRSRNTIIRALQALRAHGFLDWIRRYVPTGNEGRGPQVQQTSNAYRLFLPARAVRLLGRYFTPPPIPDDHSHAQEARAAEIEAHRAGLTELERTMLDIDPETPLGAALLRMAEARARCAERESHKRAESLSRFHSMAK